MLGLLAGVLFQPRKIFRELVRQAPDTRLVRD
jgi:hypothetical protein